MKMGLEKLLASYNCQLALQLCKRSMMLRAQERHREAAEICAFVSTLCTENLHDSCKREASLCASSAKNLVSGNYMEAKKMCDEARGICPMNHAVRGS
jgi:hypothetical protein